MATEVPKKDTVYPQIKENCMDLGVSVCACKIKHTPTENCYVPRVLTRLFCLENY